MTAAAFASALRFGSPTWLWTLLGLPALVALFLWAERRGERRLERLIQVPRLRAQLTGGASAARRRWRYALLLLALAAFLLAMAEPRLGFESREVHRRGLDLIVIVDVSKSMLATDIAPNRLTRARLCVQDLVGQLGGDRLGLVAFAGSAFLQAPLTVDYDAVLAAANELDTNLIPRGGTNIGGAIDLALEAFGKAEAGNRAIVLLSDGEPTSDTEQADGMAAARQAAAGGVRIFTVGIGTAEGSLIPLDRNGTEFVRDEDGKIVRTRLNESGLKDIARATNGFYVPFTSGEAAMHTVVAQGLSQLKSGDIDARTDRRPIERYQWPLGAGVFLLALAAAVGERRKVRVPATPAVRVASASALVAFSILLAVTSGQAADAPAASTEGALELYQNGHYDDAYRAFEQLAKQNPNVGGLEFNAGASAYMGKQYDEALDAFGHALTSDNADLQAKSHYNFGNTLFKRGEEQKDRDAKIKDWKNAIQHYDSTLETLKRHGDASPLAANTSFNRDLVQKRLEEEMKQTPPPQSQKQNQKQDQKDNTNQKNQQGSSQKSENKDQQSQQSQQDQKDQKDQKNEQKQQGQSSQQPGGGSQAPQSQQQTPQDQPPPSGKADGQGKGGQPGDTPPSENQSQPNGSPQPSAQQPPDQQSGPGQAPKTGDANQTSGHQPPAPSAAPGQDKPRPRGEFQSQPGSSPTPGENGSPQPSQAGSDGKEEAGKMSEAQARALLDSLKGEDDRVMLDGAHDNRNRHDEPVTKDW